MGDDLAGTLLGSLKARHQELKEEAASHDIPVPGWSEPPLFLRVHPLDHPTLRRFGDRARKAPKGARGNVDLTSAAGTLAAAIDFVVIGDPEAEDAVELELFDPRLLESLGLPAETKAPLTVLREVALDRDGVVLQLSNEIAKISGYAELDADEGFRGE